MAEGFLSNCRAEPATPPPSPPPQGCKHPRCTNVNSPQADRSHRFRPKMNRQRMERGEGQMGQCHSSTAPLSLYTVSPCGPAALSMRAKRCVGTKKITKRRSFQSAAALSSARLSKRNQGMFAPQYTVPLEGPRAGGRGWGIIAATVSEPHAWI